MRTIRTEITVDAPPGVVWDVLTDLAAYREWNPHVVDARGTLRPGERVDVRVRTPDGRARPLRVTVTAVDPERRLSWVGRVALGALFRGRHTFELTPVDGGTAVVNREEVTGLLAPFVVGDDAVTGYEAMNRALKERAEARARAESEA